MSTGFWIAAAVKVPRDKIGYDGFWSSDQALGNVLNLVYSWSAILAVVVLVVAGFLFVTSRGDPAQMKRSKDAIRGAVIGLIVIILAFTITQFILGRL